MNFVFDLDGTICFKGRPLDPNICSALDECIRKGHEVIFASARPIRDMLPVIPGKYHSCRMVGGNGTFTYTNGKINVTNFSKEIVEFLTEIIETYMLTYLADSDWDYAYTGSELHPIFRNIDPHKLASNRGLYELSAICKLVLFSPPEEVKLRLKELPVNVFEHQTEDILDICPLHINKVNGLKKLQIEDFIAFGNDANDVCLFEQAIYSVCVGNHEVSKYASERIEEDAVAERIIALSNSSNLFCAK